MVLGDPVDNIDAASILAHRGSLCRSCDCMEPRSSGPCRSPISLCRHPSRILHNQWCRYDWRRSLPKQHGELSGYHSKLHFIGLLQVMAAQTRLAQSVKLRSEFYDVYLLEILSLFADKGTAIQTAQTTGHNANQVTLPFFLLRDKSTHSLSWRT
jgi:hypothetical protein